MWVVVIFCAALAWPVLKMRQTMQMVQSASNLREISGGLLLYANEHSGHFPDHLSDLLLGDYPAITRDLYRAMGLGDARRW